MSRFDRDIQGKENIYGRIFYPSLIFTISIYDFAVPAEKNFYFFKKFENMLKTGFFITNICGKAIPSEKYPPTGVESTFQLW